MTEKQAPYLHNSSSTVVSYSEKHHFGYRWYDQNNVQPSYEFGFGLSYTKFAYSGIEVNSDTKSVSLNIKNVGKVKGSEITQIYLAVPETKNYQGGYRSPKTLKGFSKMKDLEPGEERRMTIMLPERSFQYWSVEKTKWVTEPGEYGVLVGASSRDIRLNGMMKV
jgi:beta-glucosidase